MKKYIADKDGTKYCLKFDIKKFYPSINREILKRQFRRKFKDKDLVELVEKIIDSAPTERGVPIGSYLSQYLANFYLNDFDHWLKEVKRVKYVVRYMDDVVIMHESKEYLHQLRKEVQEYLSTNLDVELKGNCQVFPTRVRGVDFIGYRFFGDYVLLRKTTVKSFRQRILSISKKMNMSHGDFCAVNSYAGWIKWCNGYKLTKKYMDMIQDKIEAYKISITEKGTAV